MFVHALLSVLANLLSLLSIENGPHLYKPRELCLV